MKDDPDFADGYTASKDIEQDRPTTDVAKRLDAARDTQHEFFPDVQTATGLDLVAQQTDACNVGDPESRTVTGYYDPGKAVTGYATREIGHDKPWVAVEETGCDADPLANYNRAIGSSLGLQAGLVQGRRYDYHDEQRRQSALSFALEYTRAERKTTADGVVEVAKTFHAFLKGGQDGE